MEKAVTASMKNMIDVCSKVSNRQLFVDSKIKQIYSSFVGPERPIPFETKLVENKKNNDTSAKSYS